jgi:hypothetical protein
VLRKYKKEFDSTKLIIHCVASISPAELDAEETGVLCKWYIHSSLSVIIEVLPYAVLKDPFRTNHRHTTSKSDNVGSSSIEWF